MRIVMGVLLAGLLSTASEAAVIAAVTSPADQLDQSAVRPLMIDRSRAAELARLTARPRVRQLVPNLRAIADVEALPRRLTLTSALPRGASPAVIGKIVVDGAATLRLHIESFTPGAILWLAGDEDASFEPFSPTATATWAPTTRGSVVYIATAGGSDRIEIARLAIGVPLLTQTSSCVKDLACAGGVLSAEVDDASRAIAMIRFVRGSESFVCTGALMSDAAGSRTPFFLTARHCISTPEEAASIEAIWDNRSDRCGSNGSGPTSTRTYGAELLVASATTDVALLRLSRIPENRTFLGVDTTDAVSDGAPIYRLSHADAGPQSYIEGVIRIDTNACPTAPRTAFIYSTATSGATSNGSSGAPLLLPGLRVAGQLLGRCGSAPNDACSIVNDSVDGSISASWPLLAAYLDAPPQGRRRSARH